MFRRSTLALAAALALGIGAFAIAQESSQGAKPQPLADYPLDICPVMNVKIDSKGEPVVREFDGRTVKLCCTRCAAAFEKDPEKFHKKLDAMIVQKTKAKYPLKTCVVSGDQLGEMGEPINYVHRPANRLVRFCCEGCIEPFKKEPDAFLAKIDEAAKKEPAKKE